MSRQEVLRQRREQLRLRTGEGLAEYAATLTTIEDRDQQAPRPGDLFLFAETAELPVEWAVIEQDPRETERLLVVPADLNPLADNADVAVPANTRSGALTLRCGFGLWLNVSDFDLRMRSGCLAPIHLAQAQEKRRQVSAGVLSRSILKAESGAEMEYEAWAEKVLTKAQAALCAHASQRHAEPSAAVVAPPPRFFSPRASPYVLAAMVLLSVGLGLGGGVVWQHWKLGEMESNRLLAEKVQMTRLEQMARANERESDRHRQEILQLEMERERTEARYLEQIANLERGAEIADAGIVQPVINLPYVWLVPKSETVRGDVDSVPVSAGAGLLHLILEVRDPQPYSRYKLQILRQDSREEIWSNDELSLIQGNKVSLGLPPRLLGEGQYKLRLYGLSERPPELVEEYDLRAERE